MTLENGLVLDIYDDSRRQAGDRWLLRLIARLPVPVDDAWEPRNEGEPSRSEIKELLGDTLVFEKSATRHFIDEAKKEVAFQTMVEDLLRHSVPYLAHPAFGRRFVRKLYRDRLKGPA
jgi:hypothetical protein